MPRYKVAVTKSVYLTFFAEADTPGEAEDMVNDVIHGDDLNEGEIVEEDPANAIAEWDLTFEPPKEE
jgi:hypothetical protein